MLLPSWLVNLGVCRRRSLGGLAGRLVGWLGDWLEGGVNSCTIDWPRFGSRWLLTNSNQSCDPLSSSVSSFLPSFLLADLDGWWFILCAGTGDELLNNRAVDVRGRLNSVHLRKTALKKAAAALNTTLALLYSSDSTAVCGWVGEVRPVRWLSSLLAFAFVVFVALSRGIFRCKINHTVLGLCATTHVMGDSVGDRCVVW